MKKLLILSILVLSSIKIYAVVGEKDLSGKDKVSNIPATSEERSVWTSVKEGIFGPKSSEQTTIEPGAASLVGMAGTESPLAKLVNKPMEIQIKKDIPAGKYKLAIKRGAFMFLGLQEIADLGDGYKLTLQKLDIAQ